MTDGQAPEMSLREAFVSALAPYVASYLGSRDIDITGIVADAIVDATELLDRRLAELEATPPSLQRVSPLEIFRDCLAPVVRALEIEGVEPEGGEELAGMIPRDPYGLAPGSSQVLGHEAHMAHLRWGVAKAAAIAPIVNRPVAFVSHGADREAVATTIEEHGYRIVPDIADEIRLAVIDEKASGAHSLITESGACRAFVVVHGSDLDDLRITGLRALGADRVVSTQDLLTDPSAVVPTIA